MRKHRFHLNVTEKCNIRCVHCYWEAYGVNKNPDLETIERILDELRSLARHYRERPPHVLTLGGGEPLVRKDLEEIVALATRRGFAVRLVTNGTILDADRARRLADAGLKVAQVSLDGACRETHDAIRGEGNWDKSMAGIEALREAGVFTVLSYVLLPGLNMDEAPRLLDLARELGVGGAKYARPVRDGQAIVHGVETEGDFWSVFERILAHAKAIRYRRLLLFFDPLAHLLPVEAPEDTSGLWGLATDLCQCDNTELVEVNGATGDVYYCRIRTRLGNLWEEPLVTLWERHPILVALRRKTSEGACSSCEVWSSCRGGCPAVVQAATGSLLRQDEECRKVAAQEEGPLELGSRGLYSRPTSTISSSLVQIGKRVKNTVYYHALR